MRSIGVKLVDRLPSSIAARLRGSSGAAALLRPLINRLVPDGPSVVEVRSGLATGTRLEILPRSEKYYWLGTYEPRVLKEIATRLRPGATYWDVGSHVGYMVAVASRLVGPTGTVVAFEPNPENVRRLRRTIELNDLRNVTVRDVALSDRVGQSWFFLSGSSLMGSLLPGPSGTPTVPVLTSTIDEELKSMPIPDLVKIDVEGGENAVLAGATRLLEGHKPALIVEVLTPECRREVEGRLAGYRTSMLDDTNMLAVPVPTEPAVGQAPWVPR
jgi:FkbM family methyltransferase